MQAITHPQMKNYAVTPSCDLSRALEYKEKNISYVVLFDINDQSENIKKLYTACGLKVITIAKDVETNEVQFNKIVRKLVKAIQKNSDVAVEDNEIDTPIKKMLATAVAAKLTNVPLHDVAQTSGVDASAEEFIEKALATKPAAYPELNKDVENVMLYVPLKTEGALFRTAMPTLDKIADVIAGYKASQVTHVMMLLSDAECKHYIGVNLREIYEAHGLKVIYRPFADAALPQKDVFKAIIENLKSKLDRGQRIVAHCHQGLGRTGLVVNAINFLCNGNFNYHHEAVKALPSPYMQYLTTTYITFGNPNAPISVKITEKPLVPPVKKEQSIESSSLFGSHNLEGIKKSSAGVPFKDLTEIDLGTSGKYYRSSMPGRFAGGKPEKVAEEVNARIADYQAKSISHIVLLVPKEDYEKKMSGVDVKALYEGAGLTVHHFPIKDMGMPTDPEAFKALVEEMKGLLESGQNVAAHCFGGTGRTGLFSTALYQSAKQVPFDEARKESQSSQIGQKEKKFLAELFG